MLADTLLESALLRSMECVVYLETWGANVTRKSFQVRFGA
jgi:hypothetical protein